MCLLIHKPSGVLVPDALLRAAIAFNGDGFGLMGIGADGGVIIERRVGLSIDALRDRLADLRHAEIAVHLRRRTYGAPSLSNVHPFEVDDGIYLMHNGNLRSRVAEPRQSDTWHFVRDVLRPLAQKWPGILHSEAFARLLDSVMDPGNRMILFDARAGRLRLINRHAGIEIEHDGLWIGSARWLDTSVYPVSANPPPLPALVGWG
ncbi:hypothetical protein [Salinisphaera sp.]|uniref:class II glutamine amidotransferase n=1 Tax=Salinisphaera sp. TaxID=1914330 RepID=UPI002D799717|nr:hypothetical protein [Salinisphaera sp.]HET7314401.1 hypothetical protein [Salinisphaera sp.]